MLACEAGVDEWTNSIGILRRALITYLYYSITRRGRDTLIEIGVRKLAGAYLDADD